MPKKPANSLSALEKAIGHNFEDQNLLKDALTHSSKGGDKNYERLEFLGDRVLGLIIAEILLEKFGKEKEGDLAKRLAVLVQGEVLAEIAAGIGLGSYISLSGTEENENILADSFEALLGALYLDAGLRPCRKLIEKLWDERFSTLNAPPQHPKTRLQEWAQSQGLPLPQYTISAQTGPDHAPQFTVQLSVKGYNDVSADGRTRQIAEKEAARRFIESNKV